MEHKERHIVLNNGLHMPLLGLGTFLSKPGEVGQAVRAALQLGYRHIDCAEAYGNQKEIGQVFAEVFAEGKISRKDVWITSKLRAGCMHPDKIDNQINTTLADLQLTYLDLYLIHHPVPVQPGPNNASVASRGVCIQQVWRKLEEIHDSGKVKAIGVSNFPTVLVNDLLNYARIKPVINQIERTPYLTQKIHISWCLSQGVQITAYGPLGAPGSHQDPKCVPLLSNPVVLDLAAKKSKNPAQILIRYHIEGKVTVIPKSTHPERIAENWNVWDFELKEEEMKALDDLNINLRLFDQDWHGVPVFT
jgi:diketogulonate reductase-like aldo/keto reductase